MDSTKGRPAACRRDRPSTALATLGRLERPTSSSAGKRSNPLSYRVISNARYSTMSWPRLQMRLVIFLVKAALACGSMVLSFLLCNLSPRWAKDYTGCEDQVASAGAIRVRPRSSVPNSSGAKATCRVAVASRAAE